MASAIPSSPASPVDEGRHSGIRARRFFVNVLWSWAGVAASFFTGFFLSPYIIRRLGDHRYGIWALAFAFIDYFMLFDFGFKSAVVNFISRARAESDDEEINRIVSTALFYFIGIGLLVLALTWAISGHLDAFLKITPEFRHEFVVLVRIIAFGWAAAIALNVFNAGMEAFQQFKVLNSISVSALIFRSGGCALALFFGHGLILMGVVVLLSQVFTFSGFFLGFRRAFPALRISPDLVRISIWKGLGHYGVHAFLAYVALMLLNQGPALLVGHFLGDAFVGYYALPSRLLQNVVDMVVRIGNVTVPNTADMAARGLQSQIVQLGRYLNRYCLALFMPVSVFLLVYGGALIRLWVGPVFAAQATPLLTPFVIMTTLAVAGQFNSSQILFGLARHRLYARALFAEGALSLAFMALVLPKYGIVGAAWVAAAFGIANRGVLTPILLSRVLHFNVFVYLRDIYAVPATMMAFGMLLAGWMKSRWLPGRNWFEIVAALAIIALAFYASCYFAIIEKNHRSMLKTWVLGYLNPHHSAA